MQLEPKQRSPDDEVQEKLMIEFGGPLTEALENKVRRLVRSEITIGSFTVDNLRLALLMAGGDHAMPAERAKKEALLKRLRDGGYIDIPNWRDRSEMAARKQQAEAKTSRARWSAECAVSLAFLQEQYLSPSQSYSVQRGPTPTVLSSDQATVVSGTEMTTAEMLVHVIKPMTKSTQRRYAELEEVADSVWAPDKGYQPFAYVIHAWENPLLLTINALMEKYSGAGDWEKTFVWIDIFAGVLQHIYVLVALRTLVAAAVRNNMRLALICSKPVGSDKRPGRERRRPGRGNAPFFLHADGSGPCRSAAV